MLNKINEYFTSLGLSSKKELSIIFLSNFLLILSAFFIYFYSKNLLFSLICLALLFVLDGFFFYRYSNKKRMLIESREDEFITVISYFQIFINNGFNVYQCFSNILTYVSDYMKEKIETFLFQVDKDKSIKPFIDFANNFKNPITHNVMLSIYQMIDEGESNAHMMQFAILFENISQSHHKSIIDRKEKSLSSLSVFPLMGAGLITLIITISVIFVMGDMINVI